MGSEISVGFLSQVRLTPEQQRGLLIDLASFNKRYKQYY
tara:strand:+ start:73 stop:189 length:117 start_codon:yes stop_codon:yes gene_type:complete